MSSIAVLVLANAALIAIIAVGVLQARRDGARPVVVAIACAILAVLDLGITFFAYKPSAPIIYPWGGQLTESEPHVRIESDFGTEVYYSFDQNSDLRPEHAMRYEGPIEMPQSCYVGARAHLLFWDSDITTVYMTTYEDSLERYGEQVGSSGDAEDVPAGDIWYSDRLVSQERSVPGEGYPDDLLSGWGDSAGGRESFTIDEINHGLFGDRIAFDSISDSVIGDEKNFVAAKSLEAADEDYWNANLIEVQPGKRYKVRLYGHNNSPLGYKACAEDVEAAFVVPDEAGKSIAVHGLLHSSNTDPDLYWDGVVFTSDERFRLQFVEGSATMGNNGIGRNPGYHLPDSIMNGWQKVGYEELDGVIPGCYQYAFYLVIYVDVVAV